MDDTVDNVDWRVYCNLDTQEFHRSPAEGPGPEHFPVQSLLNTAGFFDACRRIQSEVNDPAKSQRWLDEADRLANAFRDYQLPLIRIREADLDSAVTVFARLNRTGQKMAADEMVSALTYQRGQFHLAQKLDEFKAELEKKGFGISIASSFSEPCWQPSTATSTRRIGRTSWSSLRFARDFPTPLSLRQVESDAR